MKYFTIIVAAGSGKRMQADIPKQFMLLGSRPLLMHTIEAFSMADEQPEILVVLNEEYFGLWAELCSRYSFSIPHTLVKGGTERFHSVRNALKDISETDSVVAVHDAVRPVISKQLISTAFREAVEKGNAVPGIASSNSLRKLTDDGSAAIDRNQIIQIQTPQVFDTAMLKKAYQQEYSEEFTDDASVAEKLGTKINIIRGEPYNIKITYPDDIKIALCLLGVE